MQVLCMYYALLHSTFLLYFLGFLNIIKYEYYTSNCRQKLSHCEAKL